MQAELIYNPFAGQVAVRREIEDVIALLTRNGWAVDTWEVSKPLEATERARDAARRGVKVVISAGGDGTVHEVANGLVGTDTALGVIPVGTTNVWALQMGIPTLNPMLPSTGAVKLLAYVENRIAQPLPANYYRKVLLRAAQVLLEGRTVAVDVGEIAGRYFLMWAGIGLDATVLESISLKEKKFLGSWAFVIPALDMIRRYGSTDVRLSLDGKMIKASSSLIVVSNIQLYGGGFPIGAKARVDDGKLDVCIFNGEGFFTFAQHAMKVLSRKHLEDPNIGYHQCNQIVIDSARPLPVHVDGEPFTETPLTIRTLPSALKVIVPRDAPRDLFSE
ncbi:MAG: diacylglycerol kinase family protein [Dehalococcoidia bacterium]